MAARPTEQQLRAQVPAALASILDVLHSDVEVHTGAEHDLLVRAAGQRFVVDVLRGATPGALASHGQQVAAAARRARPKAVPLLAVPFMSDAGRRVCRDRDLPWFDLSGNARIVAPGIRVIVDGRPNRFRAPGRPASVFAPKSARVVRWLLAHQGLAATQRELARATDMSEGFVSRIVARLQGDGYVVRAPSGAVRVRDPALLLDAWRDEYRFDRHTLVPGHVAARSGEALAQLVSGLLDEYSIPHAATGLAAAWSMTRFAAFRIATFFVAESPPGALLERLGFREDARGANLWLVVPNDAGVFQGVADWGGLRCVHPVQAYLDLKGHPERAVEAAERLRADLLTWRGDG